MKQINLQLLQIALSHSQSYDQFELNGFNCYWIDSNSRSECAKNKDREVQWSNKLHWEHGGERKKNGTATQKQEHQQS